MLSAHKTRQEAVKKAAELEEQSRRQNTESTQGQTDAVKKATDASNAVTSANNALASSVYALQSLMDTLTSEGAAGGYGGGMTGGDRGGGGSSSAFTVYGPGVKGDQPGGPTYDWNSYHGIGAFGHLSAGDVAMHDAYARNHYHIHPGQLYRSDKDGKIHRWMDHSGSKNPENEDVYVPKSSSITINNHVYAMDGQDVHRFFSEHSDTVAHHVRRAFRDDMSRSAVV